MPKIGYYIATIAYSWTAYIVMTFLIVGATHLITENLPRDDFSFDDATLKILFIMMNFEMARALGDRKVAVISRLKPEHSAFFKFAADIALGYYYVVVIMYASAIAGHYIFQPKGSSTNNILFRLYIDLYRQYCQANCHLHHNWN
jgi:hypothetical protein